jgi:tetratricopeptide (TPR) repeat protein
MSLWCRRGAAYFHKQDYVDAINDFNEAIRLDSKCVYGYASRETACLLAQDFENAIASYSEVIQTNTCAFLNRSCAFHNIHEYTKAIKDCDEAIKLDPKEYSSAHQFDWC